MAKISQALTTPVGTANVNISIVRSVGAFGPVAVFWNLDNYCAAGADVTPAFGSIQFSNGQTNAVRILTTFDVVVQNFGPPLLVSWGFL